MIRMPDFAPIAGFAPFPGFDPCDGADPHVDLARDNPARAGDVDQPARMADPDIPDDAAEPRSTAWSIWDAFY